jgi:hypothetical protein
MAGLRLFELLEDLRPEGQALAVLLEWDGNKYVRSDTEIELNERARTHGYRGDRGYCFFSAETQTWETFSGLHQKVYRREF